MIEIITGTLADALPYEFVGGEYHDTPAFKLKDVKVKRVVCGHQIVDGEFVNTHDTFVRWPGRHAYVFNWFILENGKAVGWNENPSRGWSFPVISYRKS